MASLWHSILLTPRGKVLKHLFTVSLLPPFSNYQINNFLVTDPDRYHSSRLRIYPILCQMDNVEKNGSRKGNTYYICFLKSFNPLILFENISITNKRVRSIQYRKIYFWHQITKCYRHNLHQISNPSWCIEALRLMSWARN